MNSEKVKAIKKALEERTQHKPINCSHSEYVEACGMYCRHHREFVADMGIKNGQTCENCNKFTATDKVKKYADILTLINELESENIQRQKLIDAYSEENERLYDDIHKKGMKGLEEQNEKNLILIDNQKDRIAELEMENQSLKESIEYGNEVCKECQSDKDKGVKWKLKRFAQMLKEKFPKDDFITFSTNSHINKKIDETLKEFIGNYGD